MNTKLLRSVLTLIIGFTFTAAAAWAQTGTIEGQITDQETGEALISANVYIPSLQRGAATNVGGEFTIEDIPYGTYQLRVSYTGYTTKNVTITVDEATETVDVSLLPTIGSLEELVVTALGVERQINELSYSAQKVEVEDVVESGSADLLQSLSGQVAGLSVNTRSGLGASTDIILRGYNSITGNNQVLFVVDGVPYTNNRFNKGYAEAGFAGYDFGNTAVDLNAANIESITVLKGPAAAALYGSRAANGAIIIETVSGPPAREAVRVTFSSSAGFSSVDPETFPTYQREYGSGYFQSFVEIPNPFDSGSATITVARLFADASYGPAFDPSLMVYQWDAFYTGSPTFGQATPWVPAENMPIEFFETGVNLQNRLAIRGDINNGGGYYSVSYAQKNVTGVLPNSQLDTYNFTLGGGYDLTKDLKVDAQFNYTRTDGLGRPERGYSTQMSLFRQWWAVNVDVFQQKAAYFRNRQFNATWNQANLAIDSDPIFWNNLYFERLENFETDQRNRYTGYALLSYDAADWFTIEGQVSIDAYNQIIEERLAQGSVGTIDFPSGSGYQKRLFNFSEFNFKVLGLFNRQLSERFEFDGLVGINIRRNHLTFTEAQTLGGLLTPGLYSLDNSVNAIPFPDERDEQVGVNSAFASLNLDYNDLLFLTLTGRADQSSTLPRENNTYFYPSVSASINFSEFIEADILSFGKLRASYARVGNSAPPLSLQNSFIRLQNFGNATSFRLPSTRKNPNLQPEITESYEVGLQLGFFNNRLYLDATAYKSNTYEQIFPVSVSKATGFSRVFLNAGNVENKGIEFTLRGRPVITNNFSWSAQINFNKNVSEVVALTEGVEYFELVGPQGGISIGAKVGEPFGVIRGSAFVYHENGQPIVDPASGRYLISDQSNEIIGNMLPDWIGSVSNTFNYKNWSLNVLIGVRWGGDIFSLDQWYGQGTGLYPITAGLNKKGNPKRDPVSEGGGVLLPGVNPDGTPNTTYTNAFNVLSAYGFVFNPTQAYIYDGSFIKLREVGLTYSLPSSFLESLGGINRASISVTGRNLWIIHKNLPFADPEASLTSGNVQGYSGGNLPAIRNVTFNITLNF